MQEFLITNEVRNYYSVSISGYHIAEALAARQRVAEQRGNLFAELMSAVKVASLGQISGALYEVDGIYRRNILIGIDVGRPSCRQVPSRMLLSP